MTTIRQLQNGHLSSKWMPVLFLKGIFFLRLIVITMNKKKKSQTVHVSIRVEVTKSVRVNAYKRIRKGKVEKVRALYSILSVFSFGLREFDNTLLAGTRKTL